MPGCVWTEPKGIKITLKTVVKFFKRFRDEDFALCDLPHCGLPEKFTAKVSSFFIPHHSLWNEGPWLLTSIPSLMLANTCTCHNFGCVSAEVSGGLPYPRAVKPWHFQWPFWAVKTLMSTICAKKLIPFYSEILCPSYKMRNGETCSIVLCKKTEPLRSLWACYSQGLLLSWYNWGHNLLMILAGVSFLSQVYGRCCNCRCLSC